MAAIESILAIDVGGDSLKMAEFSYPPEGGMVLEKFAFTEFGGDLKEEQLLDALGQAFKSTIDENGFRSKKIHLSLSGQSAFIKIVKLPSVGEDENKVRQLVEYEAKQNVPFSMDEVVWDYQLRRNPDDETEIEVMFVVIKNEIISEITKVIEEVGREVVLIEVAPTSCYNAARANEIGDNDCEMILNIGGRCSSLVFIDSGRFFVRTIPIAGHSVTQQISKEFGIPFADAEELKRRHGFVALGGAYEEPDSEVAATVSKIVRNVMTRLHGEINRSINVYRSQHNGKKPSKLYLAGGSSVMAFTPRFFAEKLRIPVEYFNPFQVVSISESIDKNELSEVAHMFSEVIGLGLRHATVCPIEISLMPELLKKYHEFRAKIPYFYASAISLVLCLLIMFWAVGTMLSFDQERVKMARREVNQTGSLLSDVKTATNKLNRHKKQYDEASSILLQRGQWVDLLDALQASLPDQTWLTKVTASSDASDEGSGSAAGPEGAPFGGGFLPIFRTPGKHGEGGSQSRQSSEINWLQVEGHSWEGGQNVSYEEQFKENMVKDPFFTDSKDEIRTVFFLPARGNNNVTTFKMEVKLKTPIKK
ncbi:MAG: hypothetical protein A2020_15710 [Lentisphaerae bacterium GWF2_45_14]|nr:MAG: hypothetical protein A2020_15710 [Lentisphaerae bacterium GWF2_45_14]